MADVAVAYLIEAIDVVRGYRVTVEERLALQKQLTRSVLEVARWRASDLQTKQQIAERLIYATMFIREMAEHAVKRGDAGLTAELKARSHRQVVDIFRLDLSRSRLARFDGLRPP